MPLSDSCSRWISDRATKVPSQAQTREAVVHVRHLKETVHPKIIIQSSSTHFHASFLVNKTFLERHHILVNNCRSWRLDYFLGPVESQSESATKLSYNNE